MPLNIAALLNPPPQIISPAEIYQQGLQLRGLGQSNRQQAQQIQKTDIAMPFEQQRLLQEQQQCDQSLRGFQTQQDQTRLKNEEMANELAETFIANKARELRKLPVEKRAEAAKGITDWLTKRQQMYPEYAHIYDPNHFNGATWTDEELTPLENLNLSPEDQYRIEHPAAPEQPAEVKEYQYYVQQETEAGQTPKPFEEWRLEGKKAGASTSSTTINTGVPLAKEVAKNFADEVGKLNDDAESAVATIPAIRNSIKLVDQGIIAGTGADIRLTMAKALATATGTPDEEVNNTDQFVAGTAQLVAQNIKNFGSGTGLSDADREYAQKMAGGSTKMTPQAIKRILQINEKVQRAKISRYNKRRAVLVQNNPELSPYYPEIKLEDTGSPQNGSQYPTVNTQAEYDKLPKGATYWEDGKLMRKP